MKCPLFIRRYRLAILALIAFILFIIFFPEQAPKASASLLTQVKNMFIIVPPIFLLLGLLDVWVPREIMIKFMGKESGIIGGVLAFTLGTAAAGPLYASFPVASMLMKKGASFFNILIFVGAWSSTKIPMLLFEMESLGSRFALSRLAIDIIGIILIALAIKATVPKKEVERIYQEAENQN